MSVRIKQKGLKPTCTRNSKQEKKHNNAVHNHSSSRTCVLKTESGNKKKNKFREQLKSHYFASGSTSTSVETHEDACSVTSIDDDDLSNVAFIQPTPQPDKKRSIFTRRQHRSPNASFDHLEDHANNAGYVSRAETGPSKRSSTKKTVSNERTLTPLAEKSNIQVIISPLVKKNKQQRKRLRSLSSDDE